MQASSDHSGERHREGGEAEDWDRRYATRRWSGAPNGALVAEVEGLSPGLALDVGCGEGADAIWLAQRGWRVTGVDISAVAIERARRAADEAGVTVAWNRADVVIEPPTPNIYDLVSGQYLAIPREAGEPAPDAIISAVAEGGLLLIVGHAPGDHPSDRAGHRFDPDYYFQPEDFVQRLGDGWRIETHERRARPRRPGAAPSSPHVDDIVLRARH